MHSLVREDKGVLEGVRRSVVPSAAATLAIAAARTAAAAWWWSEPKVTTLPKQTAGKLEHRSVVW